MNAVHPGDAGAERKNHQPVQSSAVMDAEPALIESEEQELSHSYDAMNTEQHRPLSSSPPPALPQKPTILHRPIARRVVDIPAEDTEQFYELAHQQGIPFAAVSAAVMESHEWHRRWTLQEEEGHTQPHDNYNAAKQGALVPDYYAYQEFVNDREMGAKNPSPEDKFNSATTHERKRLWGASSSSPSPDEGRESTVSPLSPSSSDNEEEVRMVKRRAPDSSREDSGDEPRTQVVASKPLVVRPQPIRPVALRIAPPAALVPDNIPRHVLQRRSSSRLSASSAASEVIMRGDVSSRASISSGSSSLSPLTLPSASSSLQRQTEGPKRVVHVVEDDYGSGEVPTVISHPSRHRASRTAVVARPVFDATILQARDGILHSLAVNGGDVSSEAFSSALDTLSQHFGECAYDTRYAGSSPVAAEGMWLTLTKPTFFGCQGNNEQGDPMYTLGRMSFDMFSPTSLVCSLQGNFNSVEVVSDEARAGLSSSVPAKLQEEVADGVSVLRTYNIVTAFSIEPPLAAFPEAPNKDARRPIRGIMTTYGFTLPDPDTPNRQSVWITGGRIEPNDDPVDQREWKRLFGQHPPKHGLGEKAKLLAVKLLMGATIPESMNEDGSMEYTFTRPLGGHGMAFVDTLYLDESLRIVRGHRGTIFVFSRMHEPKQQEQQVVASQ